MHGARPLLSALAAPLALVALAACSEVVSPDPPVEIRSLAAAALDRPAIAFDSDRTGDLEVFAMAADGSSPANLSRHPSIDGFADWSPGGGRIAFHSTRGGPFDVWVADADGSNPINLTRDPGFDADPAWSPDGARIAFHTFRHAFNAEIYVIDADGSNPIRLTVDPGFDCCPDWSPDGRIVFERDGDLWTMDGDGTGQTRITAGPARDRAPAWSPDGTRIAFRSDRDGNAEIYAIRPDGSGPVRLTRDPAFDSSPAWSPTGLNVAFTRGAPSGLEVYAMLADGSAQRNLSRRPGRDSSPAWRRPAGPPTPRDRVLDLVVAVDGLAAGGVLASGEARGLRAPLDAALTRLDAGNPRAAGGLLGAFLRHLDALDRTGRLSRSQVALLAGAARSAIEDL